VADLRSPAQRERDEAAWSQHWSEENQRSTSQRFFSFYRKAVFSRTVRFFIDRYFPSSGVFVEAGSGTSETSLRIDKHGGTRLLVAIDIIPPVLDRCHPIMDVRVCGDIFSLPFRADSIDGIWNVGVMEHFTHTQIDQIMREFHRVLRIGGRLILLWPGADSVPQKILRLAERIINLKARQEPFRFHPDEISQLRSVREGRDVLLRNGFHPLHLDYGLRSLLAFKILVGVKPRTVSNY
jgi:SAM-dependent methyltransferase